MGTSEYLPATPLLGYNLPWGGMGMSQELLMSNKLHFVCSSTLVCDCLWAVVRGACSETLNYSSTLTSDCFIFSPLAATYFLVSRIWFYINQGI